MDRKNWQQQQDEQLKQLVKQYSQYSNRIKWCQIAQKLSKNFKEHKKTGKQCRQRWHNHLDPDIKPNIEWTQQDQQLLFDLHNQYGNKWSTISANLVGRTDNCIKNHFYSTLRKGMRKINKYIVNVKRKQNSMKQFSNQVLSKLLAVADNNYEEKLQVKQKAITISNQIKNKLIMVSKDSDDENLQDGEKQQLIEKLQQFNRNCKKRKGKRKKQVNQGLNNLKQQSEGQQINQMKKEQNQQRQEEVNKVSSESKKQHLNFQDRAQGLQLSYSGSSFQQYKDESKEKQQKNTSQGSFFNSIKFIRQNQGQKNSQKNQNKLNEQIYNEFLSNLGTGTYTFQDNHDDEKFNFGDIIRSQQLGKYSMLDLGLSKSFDGFILPSTFQVGQSQLNKRKNDQK